MGSFPWQDQMLERRMQASMTCIVQETTPARVHAETFAWGSGHEKVHVHVHETLFTAKNICFSRSNTKDPGKVCASLCIATARLRACHVCLLYWRYRPRVMYMYMNFTAQNFNASWRYVPRRPTSRVRVHHQNEQDRGKFHIARLLNIFALRFVLCCLRTSESVSLRLAPECSSVDILECETAFK